MTVPEAAGVLKMSVEWVYKQVQKGLIPHRRMGRSIRFDRSELLAWAAKQARIPGEAH